MDLEEVITNGRNSLKTDRLDMSFGELMSIFEDGELFISPEYQRVFRWSKFQQTRFIESVLLGIPIPPIFVAEDQLGKWEVVDGLQRISTIFSFFGLLTSIPDKNNFILTEGDIIKELEGISVDTLPIKLKTTIKRSICRVEIVRWDSKEDIRYELFNRLNTGASPLSDQEIRNCIFRAYPVDFNKMIKNLAKKEDFIALISPTESKREQMFLEELVLRYFAFKYMTNEIKTSVPQFLTDFMRQVSSGYISFDLNKEEIMFTKFIDVIKFKYDKSIFRPKGNFALHLFDSLAYAMSKTFIEPEVSNTKIYDAINILINDEDYKSIGTNTFSNVRIKIRMNRALEIFSSV